MFSCDELAHTQSTQPETQGPKTGAENLDPWPMEPLPPLKLQWQQLAREGLLAWEHLLRKEGVVDMHSPLQPCTQLLRPHDCPWLWPLWWSASPGEKQEHLPITSDQSFPALLTAGPKHRIVSVRPSSWVMLYLSRPKPLSLYPQKKKKNKPSFFHPRSGDCFGLWAGAQALNSSPGRVRSFLERRLHPSSPLGLDFCFCDEFYLHPVKGDELLWRWSRAFFFFFNSIKPHADCDPFSTI